MGFNTWGQVLVCILMGYLLGCISPSYIVGIKDMISVNAVQKMQEHSIHL